MEMKFSSYEYFSYLYSYIQSSKAKFKITPLMYNGNSKFYFSERRIFPSLKVKENPMSYFFDFTGHDINAMTLKLVKPVYEGKLYNKI